MSLILGIETSCDETAAAVVRNGREVLSNVIFTQIEQHEAYGGVVPEIACRTHLETVPRIIAKAMADAEVTWTDLDQIAVTAGPGLASSLLIGVAAARGIALQTGLPLVPVNHIEGHVLSVFLDPAAPPPDEICPLVLLLVSGGHSGLVLMTKPGEYEWLGGTKDDAAGEALDKGAKLIGLGYPGGPIIEKRSAGGNPAAISFPRGLGQGAGRSTEGSLDLSFSGLKTSLLYHVRDHPDCVLDENLPDLCASYQEAVVDALAIRLEQAVDLHSPRGFACVGGVAKNKRLRARLDEVSNSKGLPLLLAPMAYCTDNAAMIAATAGLRPHTPRTDFDVYPSCGMRSLS